ncbi:MAG: carbohydrate ABC transporter permease [Armatimonadota bacterium]|nr:carbohydrate ABC transporter permease [Armatimonadota bacterium]MDR7518612.1 carbohydrate ABC transporter permease [Armatimonadota bacterium]MDR7548479.1 carbohydrate ABC transporter permease [Armatimonadota bacterium]
MDVPGRPAVRLLAYLLLTLGAIPTALPFLMMASGAVKPLPEIMRIPPTWLPEQIRWENFAELFRQFPFGRYFANSVIVAAVVVTSALVVSAMAGYAFSKFRFPGRDLLFIAMLASLMVPFQVRMIPLYLMSMRFGLVDTLPGVIFPWLFDAFGIFLMRQFMQTIPNDLMEAARIDGASEPRIFWTVVLPLVRPALAALAIFVVVANWEEFLWPLIISTSDRSRTLPVGLHSFADQYMTFVHWQMAGAMIAIVPLVVAFFLFQRQFIQGIALTGMKQ